jgi:hypothetical protein
MYVYWESRMDIIFHGKHDRNTALDSMMEILQVFQERYKIKQFREMCLSVTLVDEAGRDVELVDEDTNHAYRTFEIYQRGQEYARTLGKPALTLVVDNTASKSGM